MSDDANELVDEFDSDSHHGSTTGTARDNGAGHCTVGCDRPLGGGEPVDRRTFLARLGAGAAASVAWASPAAAERPDPDPPLGPKSGPIAMRRQQAYRVRVDAAALARSRPSVTHRSNGDEQRYASRIGSFSKGLPHNQLGEVDRNAFNALVHALETGDPADFEAIPLGGERLFVNPQSAFAFDLEGADSHHLAMPPAPALASRQAAADLIELYWMALARDVPFGRYSSDATAAAAAAELSGLRGYAGPRTGGAVTAGTLFRGQTPGDVVGPYLSQFLWLPIPMGAVLVPQRMHTALGHHDYMTAYHDWLLVQNGFLPGPDALVGARYIATLRDLAQWVHVDALYQAYHQACLILLGMGAPFDRGNPYEHSSTQHGFGTFGGPHILSLVTEVATRALKAAWCQKWLVHRRLRPEAMGGLVDHTRSGTARYPVHADALNASAVTRVRSMYGTFLLPCAYPEGSPTHPSYPAGHATVAGACVTILKAWFDESFVLPDPVVADDTGTALVPYTGPALTVGHELDKLAANVSMGRNAAGIHYRTDYWESLKLGESVAISILEEQRATYNEQASFTLRKFDGTVVTI